MRVNQKILLFVCMAFLNAGAALEVDVRPNCYTSCPISGDELGECDVKECVLATNPTIHIHMPYSLFDAKFPNDKLDPERMNTLKIQQEDLVRMRAIVIFDDDVYLRLDSASDAEWDALQKLPVSRNILEYDELTEMFPNLKKLRLIGMD